MLSGPIAGRNLHDMGAEVIKVEPPEGDLTRYAHPKVGSISLLERYATAMQRPDLLEDPWFNATNRRAHRAELIAIVETWTLTFTNLDELEAVLAVANLPMGVVRSSGAAATSEWAAARGAVVSVDDRLGGTVRIPEAPSRFSDAETGAHGAPAYRGEHNRDVLSELLDVDDATLTRWESEGLLSSRIPR